MMGKATSSGSGSTSASGGRSSAAAVMRRGFCDCGERVLYLTSHSDANPGRKFWKCRNWKSPPECGFFLWDDEYAFEGANTRAVVELTRTLRELDVMKNKLEESKKTLEECKMNLEDLRRKNDKVQRKLEYEMMKKNMAIVCVILSWFWFVFMSGKLNVVV
ncbi:uncharacterized protein At4g04775-like [Lotus japonicus]|uniref:uncharacterized protein At4g04775-like n=1 Tax=Lotus japonicus TaxID=34305 RepID=UPI002590A259|nr:uncharacterized protein At4g04775-like [Lotus japonicus]